MTTLVMISTLHVLPVCLHACLSPPQQLLNLIKKLIFIFLCLPLYPYNLVWKCICTHTWMDTHTDTYKGWVFEGHCWFYKILVILHTLKSTP